MITTYIAADFDVHSKKFAYVQRQSIFYPENGHWILNAAKATKFSNKKDAIELARVNGADNPQAIILS